MSKPEDHAAEIIQAWQRERPDLDPSSIGIVTRIWHLSRIFEKERRNLLRQLNIDSALLDLLGALRRSGEPYALSTRELAVRAAVSPSAISQRLTRAEQRGWVRRENTPSRAVIVHLTTQGKGVIDTTAGEIFKQENRLLDQMSPAHRDTLATLLTELCLAIAPEEP